MKTPSEHRVILCLEPNLIGTALATWLEGQADAEVVNDPSGVSALVAGPGDVVISSHPYLSMATVVVIEDCGSSVSVYRSGSRETFRYRGLDWLGALIEAQGANRTHLNDRDQEVRMTEPLRTHP